MIKIVTYKPEYTDSIVKLITNIQQNEFGVPVTLKDQPDLLDITNYYFKNMGHFWCAITDNDEVVGTIALIDVGKPFGTIRKMFVKAEYRGKELGIAADLFAYLQNHAKQNNMVSLFLGTFDKLKASHRFYEKNGFSEILPDDLPEGYPRMKVDNMFFMKNL